MRYLDMPIWRPEEDSPPYDFLKDVPVIVSARGEEYDVEMLVYVKIYNQFDSYWATIMVVVDKNRLVRVPLVEKL